MELWPKGEKYIWPRERSEDFHASQRDRDSQIITGSKMRPVVFSFSLRVNARRSKVGSTCIRVQAWTNSFAALIAEDVITTRATVESHAVRYECSIDFVF